MPTTIASLPRELVDTIISHASSGSIEPTNDLLFDAEALCQLALVSRQWREAAQAGLWKHLAMRTISRVQACLASPALGRHITISLMISFNSETVFLLIAALRGVKELSLEPVAVRHAFDSAIFQLPALSELESLSVQCDLSSRIPPVLPFRLRHLSIVLTSSGVDLCVDLSPLLSHTALHTLDSLSLLFEELPSFLRPTVLASLLKIAPQLAHLDLISMPDIPGHPFFTALLRSSIQLSELSIRPLIRPKSAKHILSAIPGTVTTLRWMVTYAADLVILDEWLRSPGSPRRLKVLELGTSAVRIGMVENALRGNPLSALCEENGTQICVVPNTAIYQGYSVGS